MSAVAAFTVVAPQNAAFGTPGQAAGAPAAAAAAPAAAGAGAAAAGGAAAGAAGGAAGPGFVDYGPKVYGLGAKNQFALPPNPFLIQRAVAVANSVPNVLVVGIGGGYWCCWFECKNVRVANKRE